MNFQCFYVCAIVNDQLKEELIDWLKMGPSWVRKSLFLFHSDTFPWKSLLFEDGKRPKYILLDHVDDKIKMRNDDSGHTILVIEVITELL